MPSKTEENYLKIIFRLEKEFRKKVTTGLLAKETGTKPPSVTEMLKKLEAHGWVSYQPYKGVKLTPNGEKVGAQITRQHRLWETFLVQFLDYDWSEIHELAEELEHVNSPSIIQRIDQKLNYPKYDPHGDPIPNTKGLVQPRNDQTLYDIKPGTKCEVAGVKDQSEDFLSMLNRMDILPGTSIKVIDRDVFDNSLRIQVNKNFYNLPKDICEKILAEKNKIGFKLF